MDTDMEKFWTRNEKEILNNKMKAEIFTRDVDCYIFSNMKEHRSISQITRPIHPI